jgi:hypothetical protein
LSARRHRPPWLHTSNHRLLRQRPAGSRQSQESLIPRPPSARSVSRGPPFLRSAAFRRKFAKGRRPVGRRAVCAYAALARQARRTVGRRLASGHLGGSFAAALHSHTRDFDGAPGALGRLCQAQRYPSASGFLCGFSFCVKTHAVANHEKTHGLSQRRRGANKRNVKLRGFLSTENRLNPDTRTTRPGAWRGGKCGPALRKRHTRAFRFCAGRSDRRSSEGRARRARSKRPRARLASNSMRRTKASL